MQQVVSGRKGRFIQDNESLTFIAMAAFYIKCNGWTGSLAGTCKFQDKHKEQCRDQGAFETSVEVKVHSSAGFRVHLIAGYKRNV